MNNDVIGVDVYDNHILDRDIMIDVSDGSRNEKWENYAVVAIFLSLALLLISHAIWDVFK